MTDKQTDFKQRDRFNDAITGVKKSYKADDLEGENKLYLNNMNYCATHFGRVKENVDYLMQVVKQDHKLKLEDLYMSFKE